MVGRRLSKKAWLILIGVAGVAATRFYRVREMLAALLLFAILYGCIEIVLLIVFVLDRAGEALLEFLEVRGKVVLQQVRAGRTVAAPRPRA
jgi:hypothetical protein